MKKSKTKTKTQKTKTKKRQQKQVTKGFLLNENKRMQEWNPYKPTKLDWPDILATSILPYYNKIPHNHSHHTLKRAQ